MAQLLGLLVFCLGPRLFLASVVLGILYFFGVLFYNVFFHPLRKYPGPKWWAATRVPYARMVFSGQAHKKILELHKKYGSVVRVAPDELSFISPDAWKDVMGHRKHGEGENGKDVEFWKAQRYSIIAATRENHGRMRRILAHGFSAQSMLEQQPLIQSYVDLLIQKLHDNCDGGKQPLEMTSWYNWTTFDIIGDLAFGEPFGCLENSEYHPWVSLIFSRVRGSAINTTLGRFPFGSKLLKMFTSKETFRGFYAHSQLTKQKVAKRLAHSGSRPDFMDAMTRRGNDQKMTPVEIHDNSSLLIVAGSETTATALCGTTYFLATNPHVLEMVTQEIRSSFTSEGEIDLLSVSKLSYMLAVINESLRLFPPVPFAIPRKAQPGGDMICGQYVPEDTLIGVWQWPMYHMPGVFTMTESFIPERWLGDPRFANDSVEAFQPFSIGPRNCIGKNLAYAEMRLILAKILWNFDIQIHTDSKDWLERNTAYFLWQKPEMHIHLTPKKK